MASKLIYSSAHEAENSVEAPLREAFQLLELQLRPPFPLTIPTQPEYLQINQAIIYGILCEPHLAKVHIKHLHGIVTDGYGVFVNMLTNIVNELYPKFVESAKVQLIWVTKEMVYVSALGIDSLLVALLRQIIGGDFSEGNLWLSSELLSLFLANWDCLLEEEPLVLTSALYTYLRLLADHYSMLNNMRIEALRRTEIDFCVRFLREHFHLCLKIGRDLVRLLQDLVHIPEFRAIWKDLLVNPGEFRTQDFLDISQLYHSRTSSRYFLLRITPEMETHLRFLLTHVKLGSQKRYQIWFMRKFLCASERETLMIDIVRFICCAHHPPNEIIQSDVIPRWAVIGWLLKSLRKNYVEANVKLALFYDWLFFDQSVDNIMNIEPAILLMVSSIPKYIDMTHTLLEFLFLLVDNYDIDRKNIVVRGVSSSLDVLVRNGVVDSLDVLTSCDMLSSSLKERLGKLSVMIVSVSKELPPAHVLCHSLAPLNLLLSSSVESQKPIQGELKGDACMNEGGIGTKPVDSSIPFSVEPVTSCSFLRMSSDIQVGALENLVQNLGETFKSSKIMGLRTLDKILFSLVNLDSQGLATDFVLTPGLLSRRIAEEFELIGYKLFSPFEFFPHDQSFDEEIESATALAICYYIFSEHVRMQDMLLFWSRNGFPVGACLLSYASRLSYDARVLGFHEYSKVESNSVGLNKLGMSLLKFHVEQYYCFMSGKGKESLEATISASKVDEKLVAKLVDGAFAAYRCFLVHTKKYLYKKSDRSLAKLLFSDLISYAEWENKRLKLLLCSIYCHLPDLSVGEGDIMRLLVHQLDHAGLIDMQLEIGLKRFSILGESTETISHLIKSSFSWGCVEQHKFWGLIRSELAVSRVQVEKVILDFFCTEGLDPNVSSIAVSGLLAVCGCRPPTSELVGAIMLLPNNKFPDFAATVLATWAVSNASMLFDSLAEFLEKLSNGDSILSHLGGIVINDSAFSWLLRFLEARGMKGTSILSNLCINIPDIKSMLSCVDNG